MNKYKNIFWHQGVKFYDSKAIEKNKTITDKIEHLENDVMKSFLCLLEYTDNKIISNFIDYTNKINDENISLRNVEYDFQITDKNKFYNYKNKYLLKIISKLTKKIENINEYVIKDSIPDGAIYDSSSVILIEAKTQSPLYSDQIKRHIENYIPNAIEIEIFWEDIYNFLIKYIDICSEKDKFLIHQFCEYLDIIGLSDFYKFSSEDFTPLLASIETDEEEGYQQRYNVLLKLKKIHSKLWQQWGKYKFIDYKITPLTKKGEGLWFGYYNFKDKANHTNLNFSLNNDGFYIDVNAELKKSTTRFISNINKEMTHFDKLLGEIHFDYFLELFIKLPLKPESANDFYWKPIFKLQKMEISSKNIISKINHIEENFEQFKKDMIGEVENKYSAKNTDYIKNTYCGINSRKMNPLSFCVIRLRYRINQQELLTKDRKTFFSEIIKVSEIFRKIIDFANK